MADKIAIVCIAECRQTTRADTLPKGNVDDHESQMETLSVRQFVHQKPWQKVVLQVVL